MYYVMWLLTHWDKSFVSYCTCAVLQMHYHPGSPLIKS